MTFLLLLLLLMRGDPNRPLRHDPGIHAIGPEKCHTCRL
jgi:hypothetical protein